MEAPEEDPISPLPLRRGPTKASSNKAKKTRRTLQGGSAKSGAKPRDIGVYTTRGSTLAPSFNTITTKGGSKEASKKAINGSNSAEVAVKELVFESKWTLYNSSKKAVIKPKEVFKSALNSNG